MNDLTVALSWSNPLFGSDVVPLFLRAVGLVSLLPLSTLSAGIIQRGILAAGLACVVATFAPSEPLTFGSVAAELLLGASLAVPLAVSVGAAEMFGELFDSGRGQTIAAAYAPLSESVVSPMATFCMYRWWALVFASGVVGVIIHGFSRSVITFPPGQFHREEFLVVGRETILTISTIAHAVFQAFVPIGMLFLSVELCFGLLGKVLPSHSFAMEVFILKTVLGLLVLTYADQIGLLIGAVSLLFGQ